MYIYIYIYIIYNTKAFVHILVNFFSCVLHLYSHISLKWFIDVRLYSP